MRLTKRELATVLAALRYWQETCDREDGQPPSYAHFAGIPEGPLCGKGIDRLCEKLNVGKAKR